MIEINLLPEKFRKKAGLALPQFLNNLNKKHAFIILGCIILFHLFLFSLNTINTKRLKALNRTWQGLSVKRKQSEELKKQLTRINTKISLIEQLIKNRILWSKKLNQLSSRIVAGVWLNGLSLEIKEERGKTSGYLVIKGSAASRTKDEPALIGRFMQNLKDDTSFSADFAEIELGPIKKSLISQTEVMDFVLNCHFKQKAP